MGGQFRRGFNIRSLLNITGKMPGENAAHAPFEVPGFFWDAGNKNRLIINSCESTVVGGLALIYRLSLME